MSIRTLEIAVSDRDLQDCNACLKRYRDTFRTLRGVEDATPDADSGIIVLKYDPDAITASDLFSTAAEIEKDLSSRFAHTTFSIDGLSCSDCARTISNVAGKTPGVVWAQASFPAANLFVEYQADKADLDKLKLNIESLGYRLLPDAMAPDIVPPQPAPAFRNIRFWLTAASALALMCGLVAQLGAGSKLLADYLYILSGALVAFYVYRGAYAALKARMVETDFLMGLAAIGAVYLGDFREAAAVLFLYSLGETLESYTVSKARGAIRGLVESFPKQATILVEGVSKIVPSHDLQPGDVVLIRPGEKCPVDGEVISGETEMDESLVSGESLPQTKLPGDTVFAGSINGSGALEVRCIRATSDNTVNRIIHLVEEAQARKAPTQRLSEKFGQVYTPIVITLAVGVAAFGPMLLDQPFSESLRRALTLLTVSCPCALVLSAPVTVVSALAAAAKNGVLIKGGSVLESLGRIDTVCFDKTGTITQGALEITDIIAANSAGSEEVLRIAASLEANSEHLLGKAVLNKAREMNLPFNAAQGFIAIPGKGARGTVDGKIYHIGSQAYVEQLGIGLDGLHEKATDLMLSGKTALYLASENTLLGIIAVQDCVRPEAAGVVASLKTGTLSSVSLLTGDRPEPAGFAAEAVGISEVRAGLLPEDKVGLISDLKHKGRMVAMVGDGINDAPALARADVGIAIGSATDTSAETADVLLMSGGLSRLPFALSLGKKALAIIRLNLIFSVAVVLGLVFFTLLGKVTLTMGVLGHEASALIVVANGMRLLGAKPGHP